MPQKNELYLLIASIACLVYWIVAAFVNVYSISLVGVIFEILWLPMLASLIIIPVLAVISMIRRKGIFSSPAFYALLIMVVTIIFVISRF